MPTPPNEPIPFNRPYLVGTEGDYIAQAVEGGWLGSRGEFAARCETWLQEATGSPRALLTHSCTAALEAAALLLGLGPGDEVILPSFTFVTTASAFAIRGATPVFVDVEPETLNLDPARVAAAITPRTRAIVPIHYAGVAADLDALVEIADRAEVALIEDAAQGLLSSSRGRPLGSVGTFGTLSFHETKNVTCGEGGALLVNDPEMIDRAEIVWDKGTDRRQFERGEVAKYSWVGLGSSMGTGEVTAAFLFGQLERAREITERRRRIWDEYHNAFAAAETEGLLRRPLVPQGTVHNAHMYYLLLPSAAMRPGFIAHLKSLGVMSVFHYVPLHSSPAGQELGRTAGTLEHTDDLSARLVRIPLWAGLSEQQAQRVISAVLEAVTATARARVS